MFGCCKIFFCFPARCGRADYTGSAHWRLWRSCGALSPWQPNGRQHYIGHCRRGRALRENPEEVFYKNSQQDNQGNDQETFYSEFMNWESIIDDIIMFLSCSWSARWWWKTGMTSWRRVTCRTGRRLWLLLWPMLSLRSSRASVVSWSTQDMQPVLRVLSYICALWLNLSVFKTFSGTDWRQQTMPNCKPRPVCVTSVLETWRSLYLVGPEPRTDTVPSLFR